MKKQMYMKATIRFQGGRTVTEWIPVSCVAGRTVLESGPLERVPSKVAKERGL